MHRHAHTLPHTCVCVYIYIYASHAIQAIPTVTHMEELEGNVLAVAHALATQLATPAEPPTEAMAKPGGIQLTNKRVLRKFEGSIGDSGKAAVLEVWLGVTIVQPPTITLPRFRALLGLIEPYIVLTSS